uniref:Uncharacterized protein n=1 Tax=Rhizophora mucronata TaxID=61149 RepID=A0A2P2J6G2_RHIMU
MVIGYHDSCLKYYFCSFLTLGMRLQNFSVQFATFWRTATFLEFHYTMSLWLYQWILNPLHAIHWVGIQTWDLGRNTGLESFYMHCNKIMPSESRTSLFLAVYLWVLSIHCKIGLHILTYMWFQFIHD